ncbi:hypothetical protein ACM9HF_06755 [Colwellia sp. RE-S-Sl-9]
MLIISGTAEFMGETNKFVKGDLHAFTMFCTNEVLDDQLIDIENFFNERDWDQITIEEAGLINDDSMLDNDTLKQAYQKASEESLSVVIQNTPISNAA